MIFKITMSSDFSKYSYASHQFIKVGIICSSIICALIFLHGLVGTYYYPRSILLNIDVLISRMSFGIISCCLSVGLIFYTRKFFRKDFSPWLSVPILSFVILAMSGFTYFFIHKYWGERNCEEQTSLLSECYSLTTDETLAAAALAILSSFVVTAIFYFIVNYLYNLSKSNHLK